MSTRTLWLAAASVWVAFVLAWTITETVTHQALGLVLIDWLWNVPSNSLWIRIAWKYA